MFIALAPNIFDSASDLAVSPMSARFSDVIWSAFALAAAFQAAAVTGLYVAEEGLASSANASVRPLARHIASSKRKTCRIDWGLNPVRITFHVTHSDTFFQVELVTKFVAIESLSCVG